MARKTPEDPTGQRDNRARTARKIAARMDSARNEVATLFRSIPWTTRRVKSFVNQSTVFYEYDISPEQQNEVAADIRKIIDLALLQSSGDTPPENWWYKPEVEQPTRQGTLEETRDFNRLIALAISLGLTGAGGILPVPLAPDAVLMSPAYLTALRSVYASNFQVIKTVSQRVGGQVIQTINSGISAGLSPTQIAKDISTRFNVAKSSAQRIADTEVNKAYTNAKMRATKVAGDISGLSVAVRHISALLPTTRRAHAARHFKIYTVEDQTEWWDSGSNRINCHCSVQSVLIDKQGNLVQ